jgi:hypothetical protein
LQFTVALARGQLGDHVRSRALVVQKLDHDHVLTPPLGMVETTVPELHQTPSPATLTIVQVGITYKQYFI